jgi:hypothetical protein
MQKMKLKSICMFRESGSSSHTEHIKIGFVIFGFFCDFILNLQDVAETHKRVKKPCCELAFRKIQGFAYIPLVCTNNLGKNSSQAM